MDFKEIGDSLTQEEFNAFVCLLRINSPTSHFYNITENNISNDLYDLQFDFTDATIVHKGLFITNNTKNNPPHVKLENVVLQHSTHTLIFKVLDTENYRLYEGDISTVEYSTLTIELVEDTNVEFPLQELDNGCVVLFDGVELRITHDKPIITVIEETEVDSS